jgi:hypothetical protein
VLTDEKAITANGLQLRIEGSAPEPLFNAQFEPWTTFASSQSAAKKAKSQAGLGEQRAQELHLGHDWHSGRALWLRTHDRQ